MNNEIIQVNDDLFRFINTHIGMDPALLRLKYAGKMDRDFLDQALVQIEARQKSAKKLGKFFKNPEFIVPSLLSAEQATHPIVAEVHAEMIPAGSRVLDMTCGLGIDTFSIAPYCKQVVSCDIDINKIRAAEHNAKILRLDNITFRCCDAVDSLLSGNEKFDFIIADPARRGNNNARLYALEDCSPDVVATKELLLDRCSDILIKASPLLDVSEALRLFPEASEVAAISLQGECKEVMIRISKDVGQTVVKALALHHNGLREEFCLEADKMRNQISDFCSSDEIKIGTYLLDPDSSLMKLGAWRAVAEAYNAKCIAKGTPLFLSADVPQKAFPGRIMKVVDIDSLHGIKRRYKNQQLNVIAVNAGAKADTLRQQLKIRDGGNKMLYCFRDADGKAVGAVCERIMTP